MIVTALDFETTGTSITSGRIIQYSFIKFDLDSWTILEKKKGLLSNCGVPIHPKAFAAHGISEDQLIGKPTFAQIAKGLYEWITKCDLLLGYNLKSFDVSLLIEEFGRCRTIYTPPPIIDACTIFKKRENRTLSAALKFYCDKEIGDDAHDAEVDVLATIDVLKGQIARYGFAFNTESDLSTLVPLSKVLISESKYEDEDLRLSFDGKIVLSAEGIACWSENFGKNKGKPVLNDRQYCEWFLSADFPCQTKNVLRSLLNK